MRNLNDLTFTYMVQKKELLEEIISYKKKHKKLSINSHLMNYNVLRIMSGMGGLCYSA